MRSILCIISHACLLAVTCRATTSLTSNSVQVPNYASLNMKTDVYLMEMNSNQFVKVNSTVTIGHPATPPATPATLASQTYRTTWTKGASSEVVLTCNPACNTARLTGVPSFKTSPPRLTYVGPTSKPTEIKTEYEVTEDAFCLIDAFKEEYTVTVGTTEHKVENTLSKARKDAMMAVLGAEVNGQVYKAAPTARVRLPIDAKVGIIVIHHQSATVNKQNYVASYVDGTNTVSCTIADPARMTGQTDCIVKSFLRVTCTNLMANKNLTVKFGKAGEEINVMVTTEAAGATAQAAGATPPAAAATAQAAGATPPAAGATAQAAAAPQAAGATAQAGAATTQDKDKKEDKKEEEDTTDAGAVQTLTFGAAMSFVAAQVMLYF